MLLYINPLDYQSVANAAKRVRNYCDKDLPEKANMLSKRIAEQCKGSASVYFTSAVYDLHAKTHQPMEKANITVTMRKIGKGVKSPQYVVTARGKAVAFVEFGAGVYFNGNGSDRPRPEGIVGIGEYGKGHGKQWSWAYRTGKFRKGGGQEVRITAGTPAQPGMWLAAKEAREKLVNIAREVFAY